MGLFLTLYHLIYYLSGTLFNPLPSSLLYYPKFFFLLQRGSGDLLSHSGINGSGMSPVDTAMEMANDAKKVSDAYEAVHLSLVFLIIILNI